MEYLIHANYNGIPNKMVANQLNRTENSCKSKLNYLKNDLEFKWNKPKVTKHIKKVTNDTHEAVKQNIENECASLSAMKRHQKLIELGIAKNFSTQTL